ncbi:hypothetical protein VZ94_01570 [Methylocucumis oryzae]|uniref:Uncharacterized protein n=1 Tax=Methylocucumis oryzae TaxID=1632867 RepID=A0A0F3IMW8_9GAMM|nr:hypothetical protein VZ94_01570 [Methylocucumis oryzae]
MIFANAIASVVSSVTLVLIGRATELTTEQQQQLAALTALGAKVIYRPIDVCSSHQLNNLIRWLDKTHGGLHGVIHSAGVLRDSLLVNKTEAQIREVLAPKVQGLLALDQATQHCELDFFVVFSSEVSVTGNIGQSDYAAANGFCDAFCAFRQRLTEAQQRHGLSLALNWPYWHEGGMKLQQDLVPTAVLATDDGIAAFYQSLALGVPQLWLVSEQAADSETTASRLERPLVNSDISAVLQQTIASVLKINSEELNSDTPLSRYGFDSIRMTECLLRLQRDYQLNLAPTVFIDYPTLAQLSAYLSAQAAKPKAVLTPTTPSDTHDNDIAIVGLSGQFPGADDLEQFWRNVLEGVHAVTEIPAERWDWRTAYQGQPGNRWGGFLTDIYSFDALFFGISGRDAGYLDPQTRLLLMHSWWALENAGIKPEAFAAQPSGVFIAAAHGEYAQLTEALLQQPEDFTAQFASSLPNRIAQFFDLTGPCEVYEAACASSILALHKAIQAIQQGECSQALVGAVNLLQSPLRYLASDKLGYLSPDGEAKSFQAGANGFVRAEGVAVLVLKPLAQALAERDYVYAVIKGTGIAHGGKGLSLIAPNPSGMTQAMLNACQRAKINPSAIGYIEAHGIASPLSDAQELYALADGYQQHLQRHLQHLEQTATTPATITLSSLKPSIGHTEIASGLASLIKVVYALRHRLRPGIARFTQIHEHIALTQTPFTLSAKPEAWPEPVATTGEPLLRAASVSSYGDAGVNGHVVLQEFLAVDTSEAESGRHLILVSAKTDTALTAYLHKLAGFITTQSPRIADVALTLQTGRTAMRHRFAVVVESIAELQTALNAYLTSASSIKQCYTGIAVQQIQPMPDLNGLAQPAYLSALAQHWVQGYPIALTQLYSAQQAKRIALPGYAFDLQPYRLNVGYAVRTFGQEAGMVRVAYPTTETPNLEDYLRRLLIELLAVSESTLLNAASLHELGLTSLHAVSVKTKLEQYLNKAIRLSALNVFIPFVELARQLTALTEAETTAQVGLPVLSVDTDNAAQPFPLTDIQQAFWLGRTLSQARQPVGCHAYLELTFKRLDLARFTTDLAACAKPAWHVKRRILKRRSSVHSGAGKDLYDCSKGKIRLSANRAKRMAGSGEGRVIASLLSARTWAAVYDTSDPL